MPVTDSQQRISDAPFSPEEAKQIRVQLDDPGAELGCPRCGLGLTSEAPAKDAEDRGAVYLLRCSQCRRYVIFDDLGDRAAPGRRSTI